MSSKAERLTQLLDQISSFRFCGPSDDPDEQTQVLYSFRALVKALRQASRGLREPSLRSQFDNIRDPKDLYEAYDAHADINALREDIIDDLGKEGYIPDPSRSGKAFISYATADKRVAGRVRQTLSALGIESFLAHDDVEISKEWSTRILQELRECDIFIPLLSKSFMQSQWTSQEIGAARSRRDVLFIPLSLDGTIPFGFIAHLQGKHLREVDNLEELLIEPLVSRLPRKVIPALISKMSGAGSFRSAESLMKPLIPYLSLFVENEVEMFAKASIQNSQIWAAADCKAKYLPTFLAEHGSRIDTRMRTALEFQIKEGRWYEGERGIKAEE